ncbi:MAG: ATP-binding protein [Bacteroidetes bacterium]|nr:ATP-binding protein [Bacteroidota bacterium]
MILRLFHEKLLKALHAMPVVALLGSRQVGKTTLALGVAEIMDKTTTYLDLESDTDLNKISDAEAYLKRFDGELLIIDEVQRKPDLFRVLRGIVDERKRKGERSGQFLLLGSASRDLLQQSSETLAGRIRYLELTPFMAYELMHNYPDFKLEWLWLRGGFPDSFLASTNEESWNWRNDFISTYMERDLPLMGVGIAPTQLKRFWKMLAHYNGNQVNLSEIGRSLELSHTTIKNHLDVLTDFYMVRQLPPWSGNVKKRLVKSPKVYLRDKGILHSLMNISSMESLLAHPGMGASWEGFVIENILNLIDNRWAYSYYRTATQIEIDLVLHTPNGEVWAIEIKRASAPRLGRGFHEACLDIGATHKWIVNANIDRYPLSNQVEVVGLQEFLELLIMKSKEMSDY